MGLFDTILGRTKPVQSEPRRPLRPARRPPSPCRARPAMTCSGHAGVCFKPPDRPGVRRHAGRGRSSCSAWTGAGASPGPTDSFGYEWLVVQDPDIEALVTQIHLVNSSLADAGWGPQLLCSVFGLATLPADATADRHDAVGREPRSAPASVLPSTAYLVYLFKRGTFYPFVPTGHEQRSTEEEFRLRSLVADDLTVEADLDRWFPLWDLPVG